MNTLKHGKKYENTRKNVVLRRNSGKIFRKEIVEDENGEQKIKWVYVETRHLQEFHSRFTFFPLYDTDRNSYIRLYRLHAKYKKNAFVQSHYENKKLDINTFKKCITLMNKELTKAMITEQQSLEIEGDRFEPYRNGHLTATNRHFPFFISWLVHTPYKKGTLVQDRFPKAMLLQGRLTYGNMKSYFKEVRKEPLFREKYSWFGQIQNFKDLEFKIRNKRKQKDREKVKELRQQRKEFLEVEIEKLDYNMFGDY